METSLKNDYHTPRAAHDSGRSDTLAPRARQQWAISDGVGSDTLGSDSRLEVA